MDTSRIRTHLLRGGVSLAALAAAWGMPGIAQAQTCRTAATIDGVAAGTDVTCPFSDVLTFPGGVSQGPGGVPNGSQLLGVSNGTDPTHQQWTYNDPNGNLQFIFLSGDYNLRNGIGGTTVLDGAAILDLSGAGLCGAGGLQCPGGTGPNVATSNFTGSAGGGVGGTFLGQPVLDPFAGNGGFQQASADASGQAICDAMPAGASCGGSFHYGPGFDASTAPGTEAPESIPDLTISGLGFDDYLLDLEALPDDVAEDYSSCSQSGASACAVVFDDQGTPFFYGPDLTGGTFERVPVAPLVIVTDGQGNTAADFGYTWNVVVAPEGAGYDLGAVLRQHDINSAFLNSSNNVTTGTGGGVQGTFSTPGLADGFLLTQPLTSSATLASDSGYLISIPVDIHDVGDPTLEDAVREIISHSVGESDSYTPNAVLNLAVGIFSDAEDFIPNFKAELDLAPAFISSVDDDATVEVSNTNTLSRTIIFSTDRLAEASQEAGEQAVSDAPDAGAIASGYETGQAMGIIFGVYAPPDNGAQAAQMNDVVTAGVPPPAGPRLKVDTSQFDFVEVAIAAENAAKAVIVGTGVERDLVGNPAGEHYIVQYPDGSLVAVDQQGRRVGTASKGLGRYYIQRDGGALPGGLDAASRVSDSVIRINIPSRFIVLPEGAPPPAPGRDRSPATYNDLKVGSIVYDGSTYKAIGRLIDIDGNVELFEGARELFPARVPGSGGGSRLPPPPADFVVPPQS